MCTCPSTTAMVIINVVINPQQTIISFTNTKLHNYELPKCNSHGANINLSKNVHHQVWPRRKKNYESCNNNTLTNE